MSINTRKTGGRLCPFKGTFRHLSIISLLTLLLATSVQAAPTLEHIGLDGPTAQRTSNAGMSGDGQWLAFDYGRNFTSWFSMLNLTSGIQTDVDINLATGISDMTFDGGSFFDVNHDGSVITARIKYGAASQNTALLVLAPDGTLIAQVTGDYFGDSAYFYDHHVDSTGRYMVFGAAANKLQSHIGGVVVSSIFPSGDLEATYRLDIQTGELTAAAIKGGGGELNDYSYALDISENGHYILFSSSATDLPGANGEPRLYVRDMTSTDSSATTLVSVDSSGTPIDDFFTGAMSDDGTRVIFNLYSSDVLYLWSRDFGSKALGEVSTGSTLPISGDGYWIAPTYEDYSRLNLVSGGRYPRPDADPDPTQTETRPESMQLSANGELLVFSNASLTRPDGEDGIWWALRYDPIPGPIEVAINESIPVSDNQNLLLGLNLPVSETIVVSDEAYVIASLNISVIEPITITDNVSVILSLGVSVQESIIVNDDIEITVAPSLADTIDLTLPPGPLLPGMTFTAKAGGFKPFTPVQAFLQSEPVLVGEEISDAEGNVSFEITIPLDFPPGPHTLILIGQSPDDSERRLTAAITVDPPDIIFENSFEQ